MNRWTQYLFEEHDEKKLRKWSRRLKFFRFFRALGGHANDGDSLDVAFAYVEPAQLDTFLAGLGIKLALGVVMLVWFFLDVWVVG